MTDTKITPEAMREYMRNAIKDHLGVDLTGDYSPKAIIVITDGDPHFGLLNVALPAGMDAPFIVGDHGIEGGTDLAGAVSAMGEAFIERAILRSTYVCVNIRDEDFRRDDLLRVSLARPVKAKGPNQRGKAPVHLRHEREYINKFQAGSRKGKRK